MALEKIPERFTDIGIYENELLPGVPQMLEALKAAGKVVATASSKPSLL